MVFRLYGCIRWFRPFENCINRTYSYASIHRRFLFQRCSLNSFITKLNWQFAPQWNLMLKGMYETASVTKVDRFKDFRKSYGYVGSVEYYPVKSQDFRVFLAYVGRKVTYKDGVGLDKYNTNRIELGFKYRIKAY